MEATFDSRPRACDRCQGLRETDLTVGGARLAAKAFRAGLIDECHLFLAPCIVGGGNRALPDNIRVNLGLLENGASATASFTSTTARGLSPSTEEPDSPVWNEMVQRINDRSDASGRLSNNAMLTQATVQ